MAELVDVVESGRSLNEVLGEPLERLYAEVMVLVTAADGKVKPAESRALVESLASDPLFQGIDAARAQSYLSASVRGARRPGPARAAPRARPRAHHPCPAGAGLRARGADRAVLGEAVRGRATRAGHAAGHVRARRRRGRRGSAPRSARRQGTAVTAPRSAFRFGLPSSLAGGARCLGRWVVSPGCSPASSGRPVAARQVPTTTRSPTRSAAASWTALGHRRLVAARAEALGARILVAPLPSRLGAVALGASGPDRLAAAARDARGHHRRLGGPGLARRASPADGVAARARPRAGTALRTAALPRQLPGLHRGAPRRERPTSPRCSRRPRGTICARRSRRSARAAPGTSACWRAPCPRSTTRGSSRRTC